MTPSINELAKAAELAKRLLDETGISQKTCSNCVKGFENHEYGCMDGEQCLDSVAVLKKTRRRLWKNSKEAADLILYLSSRVEKAEAALEQIALLDEADGHLLTVSHAFEAIAIATKTLGKHPSEIYADRLKEPNL